MRIKPSLRRIAAASAAALIITASGAWLNAPTAAADDPDTHCPDGGFNWQEWYHFDWGGQVRAQYLIESSFPWYDADQNDYVLEYRVAIKDSFPDGYPPYFYLQIVTPDGAVYKSEVDHNYLGASGGWVCYDAWMYAGNYPPPVSSLQFRASLDNAPSVPEQTLFTKSVSWEDERPIN